jgi:hypothetical protein
MSKKDIHDLKTIHHNCCDESLWTRILRGMQLYHGECYKELDANKVCTLKDHIHETTYNINTFVKNFAFWKLYFIIFFLFGIGIINLAINKDKTLEYVKKDSNKVNFFLEFLYLFAAFFLSTIFMYLIRTQGAPISTIIISSIIIFVFCILKHFAFELSGLYRFNFGSKDCKKSTEHFGSTSDSKGTNTDASKNTVSKECACDNNFFSGLFWNGLGYHGIGITIILLLFFGISLFNNELTKNIFNYTIPKMYSGLYLLIGIIIPFILGALIPKIKFLGRDNSCFTENTILIIIKDGCAAVSIAFMSFVTIIVFLHIFLKNKFITEFKPEEFSIMHKEFKYNDCWWSGNFKRFAVTLIESIVVFLIFAFAEAGIEGIRAGHDFKEVITSWHFWKKSLSTSLPLIVFIQFLLEYTSWFKEHLFNNKKHKSECYNKKDTENTHDASQDTPQHGKPAQQPQYGEA